MFVWFGSSLRMYAGTFKPPCPLSILHNKNPSSSLACQDSPPQLRLHDTFIRLEVALHLTLSPTSVTRLKTSTWRLLLHTSTQEGLNISFLHTSSQARTDLLPYPVVNVEMQDAETHIMVIVGRL
jgi:hypothetical protein